MALVLDETFAAAIPASFATSRSSGVAPAVTYNAAQQAVDIRNTDVAHTYWEITSQPLRLQGEVEIDLEYTADNSVTPFQRQGGLWLVTGVGSRGIRGSHYYNVMEQWRVTDWQHTNWATTGVADVIPATYYRNTERFSVAGDRRIINMRWDMTNTADRKHLTAELRVDGNFVGGSMGVFPALRPGVTTANSGVRLHSIKVWDAPQAPLQSFTGSGYGLNAAVPILRLPTPNAVTSSPTDTRIASPQLATMDNVFGGRGFITGTVKEKATPSNTPLVRRVQLISEATRLLVREQWSNSAGEYAFYTLDHRQKYTVMAYDHLGMHRAVVADGQIPEMML